RALGAALATRSKRIVPRAAAAGVETPEPVTGFPELPRGLFGDDHGASKVGESRGGARVQLAPSDVASGAGALPTSGSVPADAQPRDDAEQTGRSIRSEDNPFRTVRRFLVVRDLYILFETDDGFAVVDQHALHERVVYEKLLAAWRSGSVPVQRLLVPEVVELPVIDKELLLEHEEGLANAGVLVRDFGGSSIKVEGVPAALRRANARSLVEGLVAELRLGAEQAARIDAVIAEARPRFMALRELPADERPKGRDRIMADLRARIGDVLTPEQKTRYAAMQAEAAGRANTRGRIYLLGADGKPKAFNVRLGISDGSSTELLLTAGGPAAAELREGATVITGVLASASGGGSRPPGGPRLPF
ncbi:MAG: hypothetical protein KDH91_08215, partial [Rhodoferax sp.]|nr:hypothetical protein [Rhodoferax sp.]